MELLSNKQIDGNLRRTAEKGYISLLNKHKLEELALKYFGIKDSNNKYIGYMCPYSGKIYSKKSNLVLEHIVPVASKGGTVLFNCIPTSIEVNKKSEKGAKHLLSWWTNSKYWDNEAPIRLQKLVNYILEAYDLVFKEYSVAEIEESYQEVLETEDDITISKRQNKKLQEQIQVNNIHSYLGFLIDCIKQLEQENIDTNNIKIKLKELEEKNIFIDIEKYTLFQNILKQVVIKFTGDDTKSYLTYSIKYDIKKLMNSIPYNNEQEIYNEIYSRLQNIQELLLQNNLVIEEYFNSLKELESINLLYKPINLIKKEEKQEFLRSINLGIDTKINEFIEMLNNGYIPKAREYGMKFSNGIFVNQFWHGNRNKIKYTLYNSTKYKNGYELAKEIIYNIEHPFDKIEDYIELLNRGYIPKSYDNDKRFSNGELINYFWADKKEKVKEKLETEAKYKNGYELAKEIIYNIEHPFDKIEDYIELLNRGYIPKSYDNDKRFSNGELINYFWSSSNNKEKIKERLRTDESYQEGYEIAKEIIFELEHPIDKISEYIELLNQGYIPKYEDKETKFSNGEPINYYWGDHKREIIIILNQDEKYKIGYERAKSQIKKTEKNKKKITNKKIISNKISEYIEMLNKGYIPKSYDEETTFSNGDLIKAYWGRHKEEIIEIINVEEKYKNGYERAKEIIYNIEHPFDKIEDYIELLNRGYIPKSYDNDKRFSNGELINYFWSSSNNKEKIKEKLETEEKYKMGYERAKEIIYNIEHPFDKIEDYIELLNQGYIPKSYDNDKRFSNGEPINYFWPNKKEKIKAKLETEEKYKNGYELAKEIICNIENPIDKISEYIELLNRGYIPKSYDEKTKFSNKESIKYYWEEYQKEIIKTLKKDYKYKMGYERAKEIIYNIEHPIDKISEYIELLNQGYIPKYIDKKIKFSDGDLINYYWRDHKEEIIETIKKEEKYKNGYEKAKVTIYNIEHPTDKISEYIELLNKGYIPSSRDKGTKFSNGELINQYWPNNKERIIEILNNEDKYKTGYEKAREIIYNIEHPIDKKSEYIEMLNKGYIPKYEDKETKFGNGELINYYWSHHQEEIINTLKQEEKYKKGYEIAKAIIYNIEHPTDKISEYIELLNKGYIPSSRDKETKFSNGELINQYWPNNKERIIEILNNEDKYKTGYEKAKETIYNIEHPVDKMSEYIELLNKGYVPKYEDKDTKFSNGDLINRFWNIHHNKIKNILKSAEKYRYGYENAKATIYNMENPIDKISEYIELLNQGYIPKNVDKETKFSNGDFLNTFWVHYKEKVKEKINNEEKYYYGYEKAKATIYNIENPFDKMSEYIELLNQGYIPKTIDKETKFSNGDLINYYWGDHKEEIIETIKKEEKYKNGYEIAKGIIYNIENPFDKIFDYIKLLNQGYIPKRIETKIKFSNDELINQFWANNKEKIVSKLFKELKDNLFYSKARETILKYFKVNTIEEYYELEQKKKQLKELKNMKQNLEEVDKSLEISETISMKRA